MKKLVILLKWIPFKMWFARFYTRLNDTLVNTPFLLIHSSRREMDWKEKEEKKKRGQHARVNCDYTVNPAENESIAKNSAPIKTAHSSRYDRFILFISIHVDRIEYCDFYVHIIVFFSIWSHEFVNWFSFLVLSVIL